MYKTKILAGDNLLETSKDQKRIRELTAMTNKLEFSKRLNQLMDERGMTVSKAAQHAGVALSTIQNWRSGHIPTNFEGLRRLALALEVSFCFLLTGKNDPPVEFQRSFTEYFADDDIIFDGYAKIKIQRLAWRQKTFRS